MHSRQPLHRDRRALSSVPTLVLWVGMGGAVACEGASGVTAASSQYVDGGLPTTGAGGAPLTSGIPCPVADVLSAHCTVCHSNPPEQGVPISLVSYADLTATSAVNSSMTIAQRAVARMQDAQSPMPPGPGPTSSAADIATIQAWIDAAYPKGDCGADGGTNPFDTPPVCTSGVMWTGGEDGGDLMHPGRPCITCHLQIGEGEAPIFSIAGTVYPTAHEPNECIAAGVAGATITVYETNGQVHVLGPNASGNFTFTEVGFAYPYTAKVTFQGRDRAMSAVQSSGDCNACHTQSGTQGAPGRILLP